MGAVVLGLCLAGAASAQPPANDQACFTCHSAIVRQYQRDHAMARSLGPVDTPPTPGRVENPRNGMRYELSVDGRDRAWLSATYPHGGTRRQQIVGRIGAGVHDVSWATTEVDVITSEPTDRLFFAPVEHITGKGLTLSPFEQSDRGPTAAMDKVLTTACLRCHSQTDVTTLPSSAAARGRVHPAHQLGADAFDHLEPLGCAACHGDATRHLELMRRPEGLRRALEGDDTDLGLRRLASLDPGLQRDVCARCHLDGDAHLDLTRGAFDPSRPLEAQEPNFRIRPDDPDDFRFVGQWERLMESACFKGSPSMTCTSCHQPHSGVAAQGLTSFDTACMSCHSSPEPTCSRSPELTVQTVTGEAARSREGCVDCHVRRSQPFDLPHVRTADHRIRRRIAPPETLPYRKNAGKDGSLEALTDGRLEAALATPAGRRWREGTSALAAFGLGRAEQAVRHLTAFDALPAVAGNDLFVDLESLPQFQILRARLASTTGEGDTLQRLEAVLKLDPADPFTRLTLARRHLEMGELDAAWQKTEQVLADFPNDEHAYFLRVKIAEKRGDPEAIRQALESFVKLWPSDPVAWRKLARFRAGAGDEPGARRAWARAQRLRPGQ